MPELDATLGAINDRIREIEGRCAVRGEMLAANSEHRISVNGDIGEIKETLKIVRDEVRETREAVAMAKGVWIVASMVLAAAIGYASQLLPHIP